MDRLPSLNAVRYFSVAARLQSFTAAARELNVTQGAVSRMVQSLEQELGTPLFVRNGRFIALTPTGEKYYGGVSAALRAIEAASNAARQSGTNDPLSLVVTTGFATRWLVSRLSDFNRLHSDIHVNILGNDPDDAGYGHRAQMIIRYGSPPWSGCVATRLPLGVLGVVCAPELVTLKPLNGPEDLIGRTLLTHTAEERDLWREYLAHFGLEVPDLGHAPRFNQLLMLAEAAVSGLGFALVPLFLYEAELKSGRLVQAIPQVLDASRGYFITHVQGADNDRKLQLFKKWLVSRARQSGP
jgi:LysR family transcriptional regulator, glycine cleavage system transcriptional activator